MNHRLNCSYKFQSTSLQAAYATNENLILVIFAVVKITLNLKVEALNKVTTLFKKHLC